MKTTLLLMVATTFATSSFSQTQQRPDFFGQALQLQAARATALISLKDSSYWHSSWNKAANTWDYTHRNIYHYNSFYKEDGNISSNNAGSGWINDENAKNYVYDSNHRLQEVTFEGWNGGWSNYYKKTFTYDAAGNLLTQTDLIWLSGAWRNSYHSGFSYSGNQQTMALYKYWDATANSWVNSMRTTFVYTGSQLTSSTDEDWNVTSWQNSMRRTNFVYAGSDLLSYDFEMWNSGMGTFELKTRTSFTYDTNHHMLASSLEIWNAPTATWEKSMRASYSYDTEWNQTQIMEENWDASTNDWQNNSLIVNYYTIGTVGVHELSSQGSLLLYPCPAVSQLSVSAAADQEAELWSTEGRLIMVAPVKKGINTIDLSGISKGMYFIRLDGKTGKVLKN
jgi:hypothetical protein